MRRAEVQFKAQQPSSTFRLKKSVKLQRYWKADSFDMFCFSQAAMTMFARDKYWSLTFSSNKM